MVQNFVIKTQWWLQTAKTSNNYTVCNWKSMPVVIKDVNYGRVAVAFMNH